MRDHFFLFLYRNNDSVCKKFAEGVREIEKIFVELEEELAQALMKKDPEPLHRILDEQCILTNAIGKISTKQQCIDRFHHALDEMSFFSVTNGDMRVHLYDFAAVVTGTQVQHVTKQNKLFFMKVRFTSMYAKREGNWKLVAGHKSETDEKTA